jgi:hypothetical protein
VTDVIETLERETGRASVGDFHPDPSFFASLPDRFGDGVLRVGVAGIAARIEGLGPSQRTDLAARYGIFARPAAGGSDGRPDVVIDLRRSPRPGFLVVRAGPVPETYRLLTRWDGDALIAWSYEWAACWWRGTGRAVLAAASSDRVVFDRIVENFLRVVFAHLTLGRGGLLLHGAGLVRDGRAFVFFGPSGAGKTTVTALSPGCRVLSDDLVLIARSGPGFAASSVPFRGLATPPATSEALHPLAGLYRLVQAREDRLEELSRPRAVGEVVASLPFVSETAEAAPRILEVVSEVAAAVPVRRLHFRKDPGFWRLLAGGGGDA